VDLAAWIAGHRVAVLTGAGVSTDSGIPDYRGPTTRERTRSPIQHADFVRSAATRRRYWARSLVGWPRIRGALPNASHHALRRLEAAGVAIGLITQNVDRLHRKAGHKRVVELHGALADVVCLDCGAREDRDALQDRLVAANPDVSLVDAAAAPDGDAEIADAAGFAVPGCAACGGTLKPDVVFFGGSVPRERVDAARATVERADALLVAGTSLTVFSGFRFVRHAAERGLAIAIVNLGATRGDPLASLRIDAPLAEVLPALADAIT
jgi:NAD-dependent SIR2 family protein deacetylase